MVRVILVVAALMEMVWALFLKQSHGFTRVAPTIGFFIALAARMYLLAVALKSLPSGPAYAIWTGIRTAGTALAGIILFAESYNPIKLLSLALLIASIVGRQLDERSLS